MNPGPTPSRNRPTPRRGANPPIPRHDQQTPARSSDASHRPKRPAPATRDRPIRVCTTQDVGRCHASLRRCQPSPPPCRPQPPWPPSPCQPMPPCSPPPPCSCFASAEPAITSVSAVAKMTRSIKPRFFGGIPFVIPAPVLMAIVCSTAECGTPTRHLTDCLTKICYPSFVNSAFFYPIVATGRLNPKSVKIYLIYFKTVMQRAKFRCDSLHPLAFDFS